MMSEKNVLNHKRTNKKYLYVMKEQSHLLKLSDHNITNCSQDGIKRIGACHCSLLTTAHETIADLANLFHSIFQHIYFVHTHFLMQVLQQIIIFFLEAQTNCYVVS